MKKLFKILLIWMIYFSPNFLNASTNQVQYLQNTEIGQLNHPQIKKSFTYALVSLKKSKGYKNGLKMNTELSKNVQCLFNNIITNNSVFGSVISFDIFGSVSDYLKKKAIVDCNIRPNSSVGAYSFKNNITIKSGVKQLENTNKSLDSILRKNTKYGIDLIDSVNEKKQEVKVVFFYFPKG